MAGESDGAPGGESGSAADLLGAGGAAGGDGGAGGGAADPGAGDNGQQPIEGGADPDWWGTLSADAGEGDATSNRDWVKGAGIKDLDGLAKVARDNMRALRESGRIKVPGEGAKPEEIAEFRKAIGVPEDVKGYAFEAPKDADGNDLPLDTDLLGRLSESALKHGAPAAAFKGLVEDFIQIQLDQQAEHDTAQQAEAARVVKAWGAEQSAKLASVDRAAAALGLKRDDMIGIRNALGAEKALTMFAKLGDGMAEDVLLTGGKGRFGISGAEAVAEVEKLKGDKEFQAKLFGGDAAAKARWERLNNAVAEHEEKQRAAAGSPS